MKNLRRKIGVAFLSLLVGLGLSEVFVRLFDPHVRDTVIPGRLFVIDNDLGWKFRPNSRGIHHSRYFDTEYTINTVGFRDRERPSGRAQGTHSVLLFGDSLVFGWGVPDGKRFSDILGRDEPALDVWNCGVPGYGLDQEILAYEHERYTLPVNEVMFFVAGSTLSRIHTNFIYQKYKPMFRQRPDGGVTLIPLPKANNAMISVVYDLLSPFYLPYFVQTAIANIQAGLSQRPAGPAGSPNDLDARRYVGPFETALLDRAWRDATDAHEQMSILVANLSRADRAQLRKYANGHAMRFLEIAPEMSVTSTTDEHSDLIWGRYDKHWNARANALIAEDLESQIAREHP